MPVVSDESVKKAIIRCEKSLRYLASDWRDDLSEDFVKPDETDLEIQIKGVLIALEHYDVFSDENVLTEDEVKALIDKTKEFGRICLCSEEDVEFSSGTGYLKNELGEYITGGGYLIIV